MTTTIRMAAVAAVLLANAGSAQAIDPMEDKEVTPSLQERLLGEAVTGTVLEVIGDSISIRDEDGKEVKLHIDSSSNMERVMSGDRVKAYHTDQGHVTTLKRFEKD